MMQRIFARFAMAAAMALGFYLLTTNPIAAGAFLVIAIYIGCTLV